MPTRRQLLALGTGAATLIALRAIARAAEATTVYLPLVAGQLPTATPTEAPTTPPPNDLGSLIAPASGSVDQAITWIAARAIGYSDYTLYDITSIVQVYQSLGETVGVDWFLAIAQCAHETGALTSWWSQRPRRNPAGLGVTGVMVDGTPDAPPGADWAWDTSLAKWRAGMSFDSWETGSVPGHLGRLLAYALPDGAGTPEQQALISAALSRRNLPAGYRGVAQFITDLNGRWAYPGTDYGQRILALAAAMRA